jgi:hypothetical protein
VDHFTATERGATGKRNVKSQDTQLTTCQRAIFFGVPVDPKQKPKSVPDEESNGAKWMSLEEMKAVAASMRGTELLEWADYLEAGGRIHPITTFDLEHSKVEDPNVTLLNLVVAEPPEKTSSKRKTQAARFDAMLEALHKGACVSKVYQLPVGGSKYFSLLHVAAERGDKDLVSFLVANGARLNTPNELGLSPLHLAASKGFLDVVKELIRAGAPMNQTDFLGNTPLHLSTSSDIRKALVKKGANAAALNQAGMKAADQ